MNGKEALGKAGVALAGMVGCFGVLFGIYLLLARHVETAPENAAVVAQDHESSYIPVIRAAEAATQSVATPESQSFPPIELKSVEEMQSRIRSMLDQHETVQAARWNEINQGNLRAESVIQCYQSGQGRCE